MGSTLSHPFILCLRCITVVGRCTLRTIWTWRWSARPKHVAHFNFTSKDCCYQQRIIVVLTAVYIFNLFKHNGMENKKKFNNSTMYMEVTRVKFTAILDSGLFRNHFNTNTSA